MNTIRHLDIDKDLEQFKDLSIKSFGTRTNEEYDFLKWAFDENIYNDTEYTNLMFVMEDETTGKIIAADGLSPCRLYYKGKVLKAAHSVKSMTHPDYKRKGIFRNMTENSLANAKKYGFDIVLGLANDNSAPAYDKFGWNMMFEREVYILPVNIKNKLKSIVKLGFAASAGNKIYSNILNRKLNRKLKRNTKNELRLSVKLSDCINPNDAEKVWNNYKEKYDLCLVRDGEFFDYRYNKRPDVNYKSFTLYDDGSAVGIAVIHEAIANGKKMISLLECFTDPTNDTYIESLCKAFVRYAIKNNIEYIVSSTGLFGNYKKVMTGLGFMVLNASNTVMICKPLTDEAASVAQFGYSSWHLTQGDGESDWDLI